MEKLDLTNIAETIKGIKGVQSARVWDRVAGKERIYIDLTKHNGGASWNGGKGNTVVVHASGRVEVGDNWAGAATFQRHRDLGTIEAIEEAVRA